MADVFPYEVYALRAGGSAPLFALVSPVRVLLVLIEPGAPELGRSMVTALKEIDCTPRDVRDIVHVGEDLSEGLKSVAAFADAWIHRVTGEKDLLAGINAVHDETGRLTLRVMTRSGRLTLPRQDQVPPGSSVRLD